MAGSFLITASILWIESSICGKEASGEHAGVLLRKEAFGNSIDQGNVQSDGQEKNGEGEEGILQNPAKAVAIPSEESFKHSFRSAVEAAVFPGMFVAQQVRAHHGRGTQRNDHGDQNGGGEGDGKLAEEASYDSAHQQKGDEHGDQ